jgi:riboflavin synthase
VALADLAQAPIALGDSVCISGVCLTMTHLAAGQASFDVIAETLRRSTLGAKQVSDRLNLELSLKPNSFLGGHFVQGHVDAVGTVVDLRDRPEDWRITFEIPAEQTLYIAPKGSVAVDGVSMTVAEVTDRTFTLAVIPTTLQRTTLAALRRGAQVNVETDILARTVVHYLRQMARIGGGGAGKPLAGPGVSLEKLVAAGLA